MAAYEAANGEAMNLQGERDRSRDMALAVRSLFYRMRGIQTP